MTTPIASFHQHYMNSIFNVSYQSSTSSLPLSATYRRPSVPGMPPAEALLCYASLPFPKQRRCPICELTFTVNDRVCQLPCSDLYHASCANRVMQATDLGCSVCGFVIDPVWLLNSGESLHYHLTTKEKILKSKRKAESLMLRRVCRWMKKRLGLDSRTLEKGLKIMAVYDPVYGNVNFRSGRRMLLD